MKKILSKSQANTFIDCPYKWKCIYINKIRSQPSPAQQRGIDIHSKIENFYKSPKVNTDLKNFISFELRRVKEMIKANKFDQKYFFPLYQELKLQNEELGLKGICDAVYINPKDDKLIIIDFKTGKYYPNKFDDYRFELAVYAELVRCSGKTNKEVKYGGIYFTDVDKLFFEELKQETIDKMYKTMDYIREEIKKENYEPKKNKYCWWCQFKKSCSLMK